MNQLFKIKLLSVLFLLSNLGKISCQQCTNFYTIFANDNCVNIAGAFRTTQANLVALNPGLNCNALQVGQRICVSGTITTTTVNPVAGCTNFYTIFANDNCANIAAAFRTTQANLITLNPGLNCNALPVGQRICVAGTSTTTTTTVNPVASCTNFYTIFANDNCANIAAAFRITQANLVALNTGLNCNALPVGQRICVAGTTTTTTTTIVNPVAGCTNFYTIFANDNCVNIAGAFRTTQANLVALNPGLNCNALQVGQRICVAGTTTTTTTTTVNPVAGCTNFYTIFANDNCVNIAGAFRTTQANLVALNPGLNCNALPVGQRICVAGATTTTTTTVNPVSSCTNFYTIFANDNCANIAAAFRTTQANLITLNPGLNCNALPVGQRICVAGTATTTTTTVNPVASCTNFYTIFANDNCANIAAAFRITQANLVALNPGLNCNALQVSQRICVAGANTNVNTANTCNNFYTIFQGDTCFNIASAFRLTLQAFINLNPGINCNALTIGARVCVS